jgi:large-conductance mechanosensitive channel
MEVSCPACGGAITVPGVPSHEVEDPSVNKEQAKECVFEPTLKRQDIKWMSIPIFLIFFVHAIVLYNLTPEAAKRMQSAMYGNSLLLTIAGWIASAFGSMVALYLINSVVTALISCVLIAHNQPFKVSFKIWFSRALYVFVPFIILGAIIQCNDMVAVKDKLDKEYHERYRQSLMEADRRRTEESFKTIMELTKSIQESDEILRRNEEAMRKIKEDQRKIEESRRSVDEMMKSMRKNGGTQ